MAERSDLYESQHTASRLIDLQTTSSGLWCVNNGSLLDVRALRVSIDTVRYSTRAVDLELIQDWTSVFEDAPTLGLLKTRQP